MLKLSSTSKTVLKFLCVFVLLSVADYVLTLRLIESGDGDVRESNPVAEYWYVTHGWWGMAGFKLAMVMLVSGVAIGISRVRLRTGELVLVFACGAQAATVLNSIFLDRLVADRGRSDTPTDRIAPELPGIMQLSMYAVQKELGLSAAQVDDLMKRRDQRRTLVRKFGHVGEKEWNTKLYEQLAQESMWLEGLAPPQRERLQQIVLQLQRADAFRDEEVLSALDLTEAQREHITDILDAPELAKRGEPFRGQRPGTESVVEIYPEPLADILALLTAHQRFLWDTMIGSPFAPDATEALGAQ